MLTLLDLFSGIGGFSLAAHWTGAIKTAGFCEIDPYCCKVLAKNFPGIPIHGDIRELKGTDVGPADIISGGFPCQPFSVAGKRAGAKDNRHLWPEMLRIISEVRPAWVLGENVDGLVRMGIETRVLKVESRNASRTEEFDSLRRIFTREEIMLLFSLLDDLEALGYGTLPLVIPACGVDAPHLRYRVWIVAHAARRENIGRKRGFVESAERARGRLDAPAITGGEDVAHADRSGCGEQRRTVASESEHAAIELGGRRVAESELRGVDDGLPEGLDETRWPEEGEGVPRVAVGVPDRVARLRTLGNSIVPQVAYQLFKAMIEVEKGQSNVL